MPKGIADMLHGYPTTKQMDSKRKTQDMSSRNRPLQSATADPIFQDVMHCCVDQRASRGFLAEKQMAILTVWTTIPQVPLQNRSGFVRQRQLEGLLGLGLRNTQDPSPPIDVVQGQSH